MGKIIGKRVIFKTYSKIQFKEIIERWMEHCGADMYYYGSFFYDINGDRYDDWDMHTWTKQSLLDEKQRIVQMTVRQVFESVEFWDTISLTVTEIIQRKLLKYTDRVLHFYCEQLQTTAEETAKFMCELILANSEIEVDGPVELRDLKVLLSADGELKFDDILSTFKAHFNLISDNGSHIYFFPTVLLSNVINVTTIISPSSFSRDILFYIQGGLAYCSKELIADTVKYLSRKAEMEAIKSAKAAIMSRNLSHNLGSHVMSYLKQSLKSVADMEKSGALEEFSAKGKELPSIGKEQEKPELPYLVGTGRFISYLQERQDYIATVSTDYIPYPSVVNFKDAIYDELNPDYRFRRHTEWKGHKPANILLENIARSEGLSRQAVDDQKGNNIILRYRNFDGLNINDAKIDYDNLRRWNFSLPGGIMGRQAVFSIVENVIRNAAKHGARNAGDDLIVTFDIIDPFDSNELNGFDNIFKARFNKEKSHDIDDLYILTLTTNTKADGDVLKKIIRAINASLVDEGGNLNKSNKGIKEMVISAAWLRNLRIEELDRKTRSTITPILWVRSVEGNLQYVFCLPRVKEVALITDDNNSLLAKKDDNLWKSNGWYVYTLKEYEDLSSRNFNFVILDKNLYGKKEEARQCSTNRFFVEAETTNLSHQEIKFSMDECKDYDEEKLDKALRGLYEQLAGSKNDIIIAISDESVTDIESAHVVDIQSLSSKENSLYKYKYIYRKHNDTKVEFDKLVNIYSSGSDWGELEFVEGITGGNSTDRLIRHTVIDDLWAFKHFHAMNTKVAIFDERLFAYTTGIELSVLQSAHMDWDGILKDKNDDEARSYVKSFDNLHSRLISTDRELRVEFRNYDKKSVLTFAKAHYSSYAIIPVIDVSSEVGHKKKIDLFTLTKAKDGLLIWGVSFANQRKADVYGNVEVVGKIVFKINNDKTLPIVIRNDEYGMMYDYISLHQGLLDKVYEAFPKQLVSSEGKLEVTKAIYNKFVNPQEESNDYLRGMSIHSGRSKPNEKDMPQHQPFLQYSAIENAFSDCKYTLVEVLDFACFEKHNNE